MNTTITGSSDLTLPVAPQDLQDRRGSGGSLLARLNRNRTSEPDTRPAWLRRRDEGLLRAKDLSGAVR